MNLYGKKANYGSAHAWSERFIGGTGIAAVMCAFLYHATNRVQPVSHGLCIRSRLFDPVYHTLVYKSINFNCFTDHKR